MPPGANRRIELLRGDLDPRLVEVGLVIGLLVEEDERLLLETDWFSHPIERLERIPRDRAAELVDLVTTLLGSVSEEALGNPDEIDGRTWYPIPRRGDDPDATKPTGLYLVTTTAGVATARRFDGVGARPRGDPQGNGDGPIPSRSADQEVVVGLGLSWPVDRVGLRLVPFIHLPVLSLSADPGFILGRDPVELGVLVLAELGNDVLSFEGVKIGSRIVFDGLPPEFDIVLLNLSTPDAPVPEDRSLLDLVEDVSIREWISVGLAALAAQLAEVRESRPELVEGDVAAMVYDLLALLGLAGDTPPFGWEELLDDPGRVQDVFDRWLRSILGSPETTRNWLYSLWSLRRGVLPDPARHPIEQEVRGAGTPADPWSVVVLEGNAPVALTVASVQDDTGVLRLVPGLRVETLPRTIPGVDRVAARFRVAVELFEIVLPPPGQVVAGSVAERLFPTFDLHAALVSPEPGEPLIRFEDEAPLSEGLRDRFGIDPPKGRAVFSLQSVEAGLAYARAKETSPREPVPVFRLVEVETAAGTWPVIDLASLDANAINELIGPVVEASIRRFLDLDDTDPGALGSGRRAAAAMAAVLGVAAPPDYPGSWPLADDLLLAPRRLDRLIANPLVAVAEYHRRCLDTDDPETDGPLWPWLLTELAIVLGGDRSTEAPFLGSGTPDDPWRVAVVETEPDAPRANLEAWRPAADAGGAGPMLVWALELEAPLVAQPVAITLAGVMEVVHLELAGTDGSVRTGAAWLPGASAELRVTGPGDPPDRLRTPELAGLRVEAERIVVGTRWRRSAGFGWEAAVDGVVLRLGAEGVEIPRIALDGSSPIWGNGTLGELGRGLSRLMGLALAERGGRTGLAVTVLLGLLPDPARLVDGSGGDKLPFVLPRDLRLPSDWPVLDVAAGTAFYTDPWPTLVRQLGRVFEDGERSEPFLRLLGWALSARLPEPSPAAGTRADPWSVRLETAWDIEPLVWREPAGRSVPVERLGVGVRRTMWRASSEEVELEVVLRIDLGTFAVDGGGGDDPSVPEVSIVVRLTGPGGAPLVSRPGGIHIQRVDLGARHGPRGLAPLLVLHDAGRRPEENLERVELAPRGGGSPEYTCPQGLDLLEPLLDALFHDLSGPSDEAANLPLRLLTALGLLQHLTVGGESAYRLIAGSWDGLLADPEAYLRSAMDAVLEAPMDRGRFFADLARAIGFDRFRLPPHLDGLLDLLAAFGLAESIGGGLVVKPEAWVAFLRDPADWLRRRGEALLDPTDPAARQALITALAERAGRPLAESERLILSLEEGSKVRLTIPADRPLTVADQVTIHGEALLDLQALQITAELTLAIPVAAAGLTVRFVQEQGSGPAAPAPARWSLLLGEARSELPEAFPPITIYPVEDAARLLRQIGERLPLWALSTLASQILDDFVLPDRPLAVRTFDAFGLTRRAAPGKPERVRSLLGVFRHPVEWILSPTVLGDARGDLDLTRLGRILVELTDDKPIHGPFGLTLAPHGDAGVRLTGLPYGTEATFVAVGGGAGAMAAGATVSIRVDLLPVAPSPGDTAARGPRGAVQLDLRFGLGAGVEVGGGVELGFGWPAEDPALRNELRATAEYADGRFAVSVLPVLEDVPFREIRLIPFGGLNQFLPDASDTVRLLEFAIRKLYDAWERDRDHLDPDVRKFVEAVLDVAAVFGASDPATFLGVARRIVDEPDRWLAERFDADHATATVATIHRLLSDTFDLPGFSVDGDRLLFRPTIGQGEIGDVGVAFGAIASGTVGIRFEPRVRAGWLEAGAALGIGVRLSPTDPPEVEFDLDGWLEVVLPDAVAQLPGGPRLSGGFGAGTVRGLGEFRLRLHPLGAAGGEDDLVAELLPRAQLARGEPPVPEETVPWLLDLAFLYLLPLAADTVLRMDAVEAWLDGAIAESSVTPGKILAAWKVLDRNEAEGPYRLADVHANFRRPPERIVKDLIRESLVLFVEDGRPFPIVSLGEHGGIDLIGSPAGDAYGVGVRVVGLDLGRDPDEPPGPDEEPDPPRRRYRLQLGAWEQGGTDESSWIRHAGGDARADQLGLNVLVGTDQGDSFAVVLELVSVGIDAEGVGDLPLIDIGGVRVQGLQPRLYFSIDSRNPAAFQIGAAVRCNAIGLPLGPSLASPGGSNPVAQNLLASPQSENGSDPVAEPKDAVNPMFSATAAYVTRFDLRFYDPQGRPEARIWLPVQRAFGPLQCRKVGFGADTSAPALTLLFDGAVTLAGLSMDVIELAVGIPLTRPTEFDAYDLDLAGLALGYKGGPVVIRGGLLRTGQPPRYDGLLAVLMQRFGLTALGSYGVVEGRPSLFVFVLLNAPLGGPAFFFVTGLAGGFGYNRALRVPEIEAVNQFPLVKGVVDPALFGDGSPAAALKALDGVVDPALGANWLAAGLRFSSFQLLDSFALVVVVFGREFELALLGISTIQLPKATPGSSRPYVYAELAVKASFKPSDGLLAVSAILTPNSFVIDRECRLTGGFAFFVWFTGPRAGDFVLTIGGYNNLFRIPAHYPLVPRVGFNWPVSSQVSVKGGAYFALTPSCVMAGGSLEAPISSSPGNRSSTTSASA